MNFFSQLTGFGRFLRSVFTLRHLTFAVASLATLIAGFYIVENWRGERAWAAAQALLRAAGEPLTFEEFLPTPPPEDQNFLMNPVFVRRFGFGKTGPFTPEPWEWEPGSTPPGGGSFPYEALGSSDGQAKPDLPALAACLPAPFAPARPVTEQEAAAAILQWTEQWKDDFDVLAVAVRERPASYLPFRWTPGELKEHWNAVNSWIYGPRLLHFRALAQSAAGDHAGALDSILIALRMAEASSAEPMYIFNWVVSTATVSIISQAIHEGLRRQIWSESELHNLDHALARLDFRSDLRRAWRGDRLYMNHIMDERTAAVRAVFGQDPSRDALIATWCPRGWLRQNQAQAVAWQFDQQARLQQPFFERSKAAPLKKSSWWTPYSWWLSIWLHGAAGLESAMDDLDCRIGLARVAVALELHRLSHGDYPATLKDLVPALSPPLHLDPYSGSALRYDLTTGRPKLWSVGPNQRNDGGGEAVNDADDIVWAYPSR